MEFVLKTICPKCNGSLVYSAWVKPDPEQGLVWTEFDCWCVDTE